MTAERGVAVVIVDVQREFMDANQAAGFGSWSKAFCIPGVRSLIAHAQTRGWPIIQVGTRHLDGSTLTPHLARRGVTPFCVAGTAGEEFVIDPSSGHGVVYKTQYNGFFNTDLESRIGPAANLDLVVAGVATDCCILHTVFEADRLGYRTFVPLQAVSGSSVHAFVGGLGSVAKSAANVIDLPSLLAGSPLDRSAISLGEVSTRAEEWFANQEERLSRVSKPLTLESLIEHLG